MPTNPTHMFPSAEPKHAVRHALWEAKQCLDTHAFCASSAMLRKALDVWSKDYERQHPLSWGPKEKNDLYNRLRKIADANPIFKDKLLAFMDNVRDEANGALHDSTVCGAGMEEVMDPPELGEVWKPYRSFHDAVHAFLMSAIPEAFDI